MADELTQQTTTTTDSVGTDNTYKAKSYQQTVDDLNTMYNNNQNSINSMYDAQKQSNLANLESAYQNNLSNYQASEQKLNDSYASQANQLAAQYERQRRNNNIQAMGNGLNTGAQSQMALANANAYQSAYGNMMTQKASDLAENQRNIDNLTAQYNISVNEAIANNDYERAAKLFDEYNNNYTRMKDAENTAYNRMAADADMLAQYGDFSGYSNLGYTSEQIQAMQTQWTYNNPLLAYNLGKIDAAKYYSLTGSYPPGYSVASPYSGGGGGYDYTPTPTDTRDQIQKDIDDAKSQGSTAAQISSVLRQTYNLTPSAANKYENYAKGRDANYYVTSGDR